MGLEQHFAAVEMFDAVLTGNKPHTAQPTTVIKQVSDAAKALSKHIDALAKNKSSNEGSLMALRRGAMELHRGAAIIAFQHNLPTRGYYHTNEERRHHKEIFPDE